ncbi:4911_t:CDS:2 [Scutellospora calospora]|uniref:4911_t:CDS:1 n=1 Tax=Scutellospora calospora TaxID=85575 RepID=A0ACA9K909_9GLOM|nr:4911_t:CDS:2 [Scutellospora calospora]
MPRLPRKAERKVLQENKTDNTRIEEKQSANENADTQFSKGPKYNTIEQSDLVYSEYDRSSITPQMNYQSTIQSQIDLDNDDDPFGFEEAEKKVKEFRKSNHGSEKNHLEDYDEEAQNRRELKEVMDGVLIQDVYESNLNADQSEIEQSILHSIYDDVQTDTDGIDYLAMEAGNKIQGQTHKRENEERHSENEERHSENEERHSENEERHSENEERHSENEERHSENEERHSENEERHSENEERHVKNSSSSSQSRKKRSNRRSRKSRNEIAVETKKDIMKTNELQALLPRRRRVKYDPKGKKVKNSDTSENDDFENKEDKYKNDGSPKRKKHKPDQKEKPNKKHDENIDEVAIRRLHCGCKRVILYVDSNWNPKVSD